MCLGSVCAVDEETTARLSPATLLPLCHLWGHWVVEHVRKELTMVPWPLSAQSQQLVKLGAAAAALCGYCPGTGLSAEGGNACCVVSTAWRNRACSCLGWYTVL